MSSGSIATSTSGICTTCATSATRSRRRVDDHNRPTRRRLIIAQTGHKTQSRRYDRNRAHCAATRVQTAVRGRYARLFAALYRDVEHLAAGFEALGALAPAGAPCGLVAAFLVVEGGAPLELVAEDMVSAVECYGEGDAWRAVSADYFSGTLLVWDLDKGGAPLLKLVGHTQAVLAIACHGEGDDWCIVSGSGDGMVRLWDGAAGAVYPLGSIVASVAFAPRAGEVSRRSRTAAACACRARHPRPPTQALRGAVLAALAQDGAAQPAAAGRPARAARTAPAAAWSKYSAISSVSELSACTGTGRCPRLSKPPRPAL